MDLFSVFTLLGGLAIFLFGMNVMGEGLEKYSGSKLKSVLEHLTSNPIKGMLLGIAVTAVIQSSSATTVMVVGFVNSGLMSLGQSIGIIMGANIGTTVTSWLLSMTGIESGNFFIQLLKPANFAPILAFVGIVLTMVTRNQKKKYLGSILLGFAVLMTGMEMMSGAAEPLADMPEFQNILILFSNPLFGIIAGALLTAIIQSSSASVGILQALANSGAVQFPVAVPIILGQNIGTCVTAMLSSVGANKNARRAAVVHLCFNIIGTLVFLAVFYTANAFLKFPFMERNISAVEIAIVHSVFNVFATLVMLPFTKQLEKLAYLIIKDDKKSEEHIEILDERLMNTPSVALARCKEVTNIMARLSCDTLQMSLTLLDKFDSVTASIVRENEGVVDKYEDMLGTYLVRLSQKPLSADDSRGISSLLHSIGDFERIADHSVNLVEAAEEINDKKVKFSDDAVSDISVMRSALSEIIEMTGTAFEKNDIALAKRVEPLEQLIDKMKIKLKSGHVERLQRGECSIETGFVFSDLITNYERVADHCSNIAVCLIQIANDSFDMHEYLNEVKAGQGEFIQVYDEFRRKYHI